MLSPAKNRQTMKDQNTWGKAPISPNTLVRKQEIIMTPLRPYFSARISPQSAPNIQPAKMIEEERLDRNALSHTRSNCWKTKLSLWKEAQDIRKWCGNSTSYKTRTSDKLDETVLMNYDGTILIVWKTSFENKFCVREKAGSK